MEKFKFSHSLKCIPTPTQTAYMKKLLSQTEKFIQRLRWRVFFHLNPDVEKRHKETYGFKTNKTAPQSPELMDFEKDLADLLAAIKFTDHRSPFQNELKKNIQDIKKCKDLLISADKTTNIYKVSANTYKKLLTDNITKDYKQTTHATVKQINTEARAIAAELELGDRIEVYSDSRAFVTLKDHKENFENDPKCRLINPAKSNIGKISKQLLQQLNKNIRANTELTQWQSTGAVLKWFNSIPQKPRKRFLQMDIVEFYPSITEDLLNKALDWASTVADTPISQQTRDIVRHARQSLLFSKPTTGSANIPWIKKAGMFDVTMGAPDGAEVCELVGLYILKEVKARFPELDFGLYRDDGLASHRRIGGRRMEEIRQGLHQLFRSHGLRITIEPPNLMVVNFLDVKLNLETGTHCPYRKPNDEPKYVHARSDHPPTVIKGIPLSVNKRLSSISSSAKEFDEAKDAYQKALNESGYHFNLTYEAPTPPKARRNNGRVITWFNPPYSQSVQTNVGKQFLALIDKHFKKPHILSSLLNRSTVKISYSCCKNVKSIIQSHNAKVLNADEQEPPRTGKSCSCWERNKPNCPLDGDCKKQHDVIYHATVMEPTEGVQKEYVGSTVHFKKRYYGHTNSFRNDAYKHSTTLSTYVWQKGLNPNPRIKWKIAGRASSYKKGGRQCDLCLTEKLFILKNFNNPNYLNKRSELALKCRHKAKFLLIPPTDREGGEE